jgi:hypothetical protein
MKKQSRLNKPIERDALRLRCCDGNSSAGFHRKQQLWAFWSASFPTSHPWVPDSLTDDDCGVWICECEQDLFWFCPEGRIRFTVHLKSFCRYTYLAWRWWNWTTLLFRLNSGKFCRNNLVISVVNILISKSNLLRFTWRITCLVVVLLLCVVVVLLLGELAETH